jgi:hypothetical protein
MDNTPGPQITTSIRPQTAESDDCLTLEKLDALLANSQQRIDDMNDKLVESLMLGGFRVMISEALPREMVAVLPGEFKGSVGRVQKKLRQQAAISTYANFYGRPNIS